MVPVVEFSVSPAGRLPTMEYVYGATPPVANRLELYGAPTWPVLVKTHESAGAAAAIVMPQPVLVVVPAVVPRESTTCAV